MLTDTHAHLYYPELSEDISSIIQRAEDAGISKIVVPAVNLQTSMRTLELCEKYEQIYCALGIHPCDVSKAMSNELDEIEKLLKHDKVVAIGETGLDYYWDTSNIEMQKSFFTRQIQLASHIELPVVIHTRNSLDDAISIIKDEFKNFPVRTHFHCFSGTLKQLDDCLSIPGSFVSFCGNVTYKRSMLDEVVSAVPVKRLLSETDSPFLAPEPYRGKKNEPSFMIKTIDKIATIKGIESEDLKSILSENASVFYDI
jgi:TatD DNase family protein